MIEISIALSEKIITYLQELPLVQDKNGRVGLLNAANLDSALFSLISFEEPASIFFQQLVPLCIRYGQLNDGRDALVAVLEATKKRVGRNKQEYYDGLQKELADYEEEQADSTPHPIHSTNNGVVRQHKDNLKIMVTGGRDVTKDGMHIAQLIGQTLVLRGHILINNGAQGVDKAACEGALLACQLTGQQPSDRIYIYRPQSDPVPSVNFGKLEVVGQNHDERRNVVIQQSQAIIILGGGRGTTNVVRQAQIMRKPIIPIGFGAPNETSVVVWHKLYGRYQDNLPFIAIEKNDLLQIRSGQATCAQIALSSVCIAENLVHD